MSNPATLAHFRTHIQGIIRGVGRDFTEPDDDWPSALFMQIPQGVGCVQLDASLFASHQAKDTLDDWLRQLLGRNEAFRYGLLLNVHTGLPGPEEDARISLGEMRIEDLPDAVERLMLAVGDAEQEDHWWSEIRRHERRPPTLASWIPLDADARISGRFLDLNELMGRPRS